MTELLTAAQMRAIEQAAIASGDVTGLELMERAGQGVVDAIFAEWPELAPAAGGEGGSAPVADATPPEYFDQSEEKALRAVILCGPGNNGGDGFVVARLLKEAGWDVDVFFYGDAAKLPPDARVNYERWVEMGEVKSRAINPPPLMDDSFVIPVGTRLIIDALFGTGLKRPFTGIFTMLADLRDLIRAKGCKVVACDLPSGICSDSGAILGTAIVADFTVTFHSAKLGHMLNDGPKICREIRTVDIGLPQSTIQETIKTIDKLRDLEKQLGHKYTHGHALILSGPVGKGGAARLAARGALRIGAGVVTLGVPPAALIENAAQLTAIMLAKVKNPEALAKFLADRRINAFCIGPGFGIGERQKALLATLLDAGHARPPSGGQGRGVVIDADALTMLAQEPTLFAKLHAGCVLTPHAGEFARLFPDIAEKQNAPATKGPAYSKVDATRDAAKRAGCVVLFKGADTVIAAPDGQCRINASVYERAAPWLATAGSGDVLAGFITGLLARGFSPMQAAQTGAWLHTESALSFGPGLIAEDLPEELPNVLAQLLSEAH